MSRYALLAGNGRFPLLALEAARKLGHEITAIGIKEEASPEIDALAARSHWISLGELSRLIEILREEQLSDLIFAGQVKHAKIFSSIRPDWRLFKVLASLREKNTDALIGGVMRVLEDEGVHVLDSTLLLKPLLAGAGPLTRRKPSSDEERDIAYGRRIANALSAVDVGQSVVVCERACVALEAMEGTDEALRRAASLVNGRPLTLVKASRRRRRLLFDVPVTGLGTVDAMRATNTTALAVDAGRTLLLDKDEMLRRADETNLAIIGMDPED